MRLTILGWLLVSGMVVGCAPAAEQGDHTNPTPSVNPTTEEQATPAPTASTTAPVAPPGRPVPPSGAPAPTRSTVNPGPQSADPELRAVLQDGLGELVGASGALGGIAASRRGSAEPVVVAAGIIDDGGAPMTIDRPFPIASVTKSFTAALVVDLAEEGRVDLDAPIARWFDWPDGDRITLWQLLTHTSGIGPWAPSSADGTFDDALFADLGTNHALADVIELARSVPPVGPPGGQTFYSNLNYILAGRIVELAGRAPLAQLLADRLTAPLGLTATTYPAGLEPTIGAEPLPGTFEYPEGVVVRTTDFPQAAFLSLMGPAAAAMATVDDLLTWGDALFRSQRVGDVDLSPLLEIDPGGSGLGVLGIDHESGSCVFSQCPDDVDFEYLGLNGEAPGSAVRLWYHPATDTTLLIYLNRDGTSLDQPLIDLITRLGTAS